jgi:N-alpha-acetyl-L-2,4-diaminobutyrate deacetylase
MPAMTASSIRPTVDFDRDGIQHGHLKLPFSHDASAWGSIMIPVTVIRNGDGPTALLTGGNHGDEYEGPIALYDMAQTLDAGRISGRVIIVPAMNYPALKAARRTSPLDGGNLNRLFPGNPCGTPTEKIADYFQRTLLPMSDYVADIHSGGKTLLFVPFCAAHRQADSVQENRCVAAMRAFNAPYSLLQLEVDKVGLYDTAAEDMGKTFISSELGGGGSASAATVAIAKRGLRNFLRHAGILEGDPETGYSRNLEMPDERCFLTSESSGLLEYCTELGETVREGDVIARVHDIERTGRAPLEYRSAIDGLVIGRHFPSLIGTGDIVGVVAVEA